MKARRRLATILALDVVAFSRLMETAPQRVLAALNAIFRNHVQPQVAAHGGRVVKLMGDGTVIEFPAALDAIACAGAIQRAMAADGDLRGLAEPIRLRAGLHVGDVLLEGGDVFGTGVNLAARLQAAAPPGGVWLSRMVADLAGPELPFALKSEGLKSFHNIDRPVEVLSLDLLSDQEPDRRRDLARAQEIRFCRAKDGICLAWSAVGEGPVLVKAPNWIGHLELDWEQPGISQTIAALAQDFRVVRFDARANGLSDWEVDEISFEHFVDDLESVFDAARVERAPILAFSQGCAVAAAFAARAPERVTAIVMIGGFPLGRSRRRSEAEKRRAAAIRAMMEAGWHDDYPSLRDLMAETLIPLAGEEERRRYAEAMKRMITPENMGRYRAALDEIDVTGLLGSVTAPCLVMHCQGDRMQPISQGRLMAAGLPNARFLALDSPQHNLTAADPAWPIAEREIRAFLAAHA